MHWGKKLLTGIAVIAVVMTLHFLNQHRAAPAGDRVTNIAKHPLAPTFSLPALTGQALDLSAYRGKVVLLDFWQPGVTRAGTKFRISWNCKTNTGIKACRSLAFPWTTALPLSAASTSVST
jgi:hypothetical protein